MSASTTSSEGASGAFTHNHNRKRARANSSEKRRADRIRGEIETMELLLERAGKLEKKDRHSILSSTVDYVKELESRVSNNQTKASKTSGASVPANNPENLPYHGVFNGHGLPQVIIDSATNIHDCNSMFCWLSNYSRAELCGNSFSEFIPPHERRRLRALLDELGQLCSSSEVEIGAKSLQQKLCLRSSILDVFLKFSYSGILGDDVKGFTCTVLPFIYTNKPESSLYILDKNRNLEFVSESNTQTSHFDCTLQFAVAHSPIGFRMHGKSQSEEGSGVPSETSAR